MLYDFQKKWSLFLYSLTTVLLFADQNILAPNLSQAADEFGFNDNERDKKLGGDIAVAFFVVGAPASLLIGCLADSNSIPRCFLFGLVVLIGEGACFMTYFTSTYTGLYATRALTGVSVGGAFPLLSSVFADWYEPQKRGKVMAMIMIGKGIGISLGQGIAGIFGPIFGWRLPFLIVSAPALCIAILLMATVVDPIRGGSEESGSGLGCEIEAPRNEIEENPFHKFRGSECFDKHLEEGMKRCTAPRNETEQEAFPKSQVNELVDTHVEEERLHSMPRLLTGIPGKVMMGTNFVELKSESSEGYDKIPSVLKPPCHKSFFATFYPLSYSKHFATTKELLASKSVLLSLIQGVPGCVPWGIVNTFLNDYLAKDCGMSVQAATGVILVFGIGNFLGTIMGGAGGDYLYKKDNRYPCLLSGGMAIFGCFPLWGLINMTKVDNGSMTMREALKSGLLSLFSGIGSGVTSPIGKMILQNVTLPSARGQAFAFLTTFDDFGSGLGPLFVAQLVIWLGGRRTAFNIGVSGWVLCGFFNASMFFTIQGDISVARSALHKRYFSHVAASSSSSGNS